MVIIILSTGDLNDLLNLGGFLGDYVPFYFAPRSPMLYVIHFLNNYPESKMRFNQVSELIEGFETPFGMELISSVHWVTIHEIFIYGMIEKKTILNQVTLNLLGKSL